MMVGKVVEEGGTAQVIEDPKHAYTRELIGAVPIPGDRDSRLSLRSDA